MNPGLMGRKSRNCIHRRSEKSTEEWAKKIQLRKEESNNQLLIITAWDVDTFTSLTKPQPKSSSNPVSPPQFM